VTTEVADIRVADGRPPDALVAVLNVFMRIALRTPIGRWIRPFALIEFRGRHSGRRYRIPAGWHETSGGPAVFTPARWRANFAHTAPATVRYRNKVHRMTGTLVTDEVEVARELGYLLERGTSPGLVGLKVHAGHSITASDVAALRRLMIRFSPASPLGSD
jgi:hypothetical protein